MSGQPPGPYQQPGAVGGQPDNPTGAPATPPNTLPAQEGGLEVVAGTYGGNCRQPRGNKTAHLAQACSGQNSCVYTIDYKTIGDPARECSKDYVAEWSCPGSPQIFSARAAPEAGFRKKVRLGCPAPTSTPPVVAPPAGRGLEVVAGTYGGNCRQPRGNKTAHLAQACSGQNSCVYTIDYKTIGDPAHGCSKDYVAEWRCPGSRQIFSARATPEAGFRKKVRLGCP